jgi:tetratricopeptide (TPR) repeat protein
MGFSLIKYLITAVVIALVLAIHPGKAQASPLNIENCIKALPPGYTEPLFSGLGNHKYPTLTEELNSKKAKDYFNQGMTLLYAFNHPEAIHSFNQAAKYEPEAAMPYWGIAMAAGPDINTIATDKCLNLADEAVQRAIRNAEYKLESKPSSHELDYAKALSKRYYRDKSGKVHHHPKAYADAMAELKDKDKDNPDVLTLYAAALMNIHPWQWWTSGKPSPEILEALCVLSKILEYDPNKDEALKKLLDYGLENSPVIECKQKKDEVLEPKSKHMGANHYFIHATEESPCPELALPSADRISELAPAAGHIQHMPSHIYQRIGKYAKATEANYKAVYVDRAYIHQTPETARYPLHYLSHNLHFLTDSLSIQGRESEALAAAQQLFENTKRYSVDDYNPLHNQTLVQVKDDYFFTVPIWTAVRFNAWDFLSKIEFKEALFELFTKRDLPFTETMWTYGQALKYLATTRDVTMEDALAKLEEFWEEVGQADPKLRYGNNDASKLFRIANLVLVARTLEAVSPKKVSKDFIDEVKNRVEKYSALKPDSDLFEKDITSDKRIIKIWERAVDLQNGLDDNVCRENGLDDNVCREKGLNYDEPPDWYYPLRESLGAAYYRQGEYKQAADVFCKDLQIDNCEKLKSDKVEGDKNLKIHKMNGRSLFGLIMSLENPKTLSGDGVETSTTLSSSEVYNSIGTETSKTEFCVNPKGVIEKLCKEFKEAWKNAPVEPSLKKM